MAERRTEALAGGGAAVSSELTGGRGVTGCQGQHMDGVCVCVFN